MLMPASASISNMVADTPGWVFMPAPTSDTLAMSESASTSPAPISGASDAGVPRGWWPRSTLGTVKEMSVVPCSDMFCTIMSTLTVRSARARNRRAAMPGRSGTPVTVTLASDVSWVTAEMMACSIDGSSSTTQVPGSQVKLERTCSGTLWLRANSTERSASTRPPLAAISSISSKLTRREPAGLGHDPGVGGEDAGHVGVDLAGVGARARRPGPRRWCPSRPGRGW